MAFNLPSKALQLFVKLSRCEWNGLYGIRFERTPLGELASIVVCQKTFLSLNRSVAFSDLYIMLSRHPTLLEIRAGVYIKADDWQIPRHPCKMVGSFERRNGVTQQKIQLVIDPATSTDEALTQAIMFLQEWIDTEDLQEVWTTLPSAAVLRASYLKKCIHSDKKYILLVADIIQHPESVEVYRQVPHKKLFLYGSFPLAIGQLAHAHDIPQAQHEGGPQNLIIETRSHPDAVLAFFTGCTTVESITIFDRCLFNLTPPQQHTLARCLGNFAGLSCFKLVVQEVAAFSRSYWTQDFWQATLGAAKIQILDISLDTPIRRFSNDMPDRLRLTQTLAAAIQNNPTLLSCRIDIELVSLYQWDSRIVPRMQQNRVTYLRQLAQEKLVSLSAIEFRSWLSVMMKLAEHDASLRFMLLREFWVQHGMVGRC